MRNQKSNAGLEDAARLLDLVPFILSHQGISLGDLATQFAMTPDEITSDLTTLWMCGLPGYTAYELIDLSFDSGFVTISNADTLQRPRNLQRNEALALLLGLETLIEEIGPSNPTLMNSISELINRISLIVDTGAAQRVKAGSPSSSLIRAHISEAIESRQLLRIVYHSTTHDEMSERIVHPFEISTSNGVEYLEAYCHHSSGYRTFRLDRIVTASVEISRPTSQAKVPSFNTSPPSRFSIAIFDRKRDVVERFSLSQAQASAGGEIESESFSPEWTIREVMSLGGAVAISSPKSLRTAIGERASRALDGYSRYKG
jgi:proteasome accessory factor C